LLDKDATRPLRNQYREALQNLDRTVRVVDEREHLRNNNRGLSRSDLTLDQLSAFDVSRNDIGSIRLRGALTALASCRFLAQPLYSPALGAS
jgi:hypothetical protein